MKKKQFIFVFIVLFLLLSLCSCSFEPSRMNDGHWYSSYFLSCDEDEVINDYLYNHCTFIFKEDNTIEIYKTEDESFVTKGIYKYKRGKLDFNIKKFSFDNKPSKLEITLDNGDFFTGETISGLMAEAVIHLINDYYTASLHISKYH